MQTLLCAVGLFLLIEGFFPLVSPESWKKMIVQVLQIPNDKIRLVALVSVIFGLLLVWSTWLIF
ncbi:MAG: DUF2065 domain-containing protein [Burkholderiales bacterium]|nr:DUF2065 domain-containing protein [Burkholderiales bacterium]